MASSFDLSQFQENPKAYVKKTSLPILFEFLDRANEVYRNSDITLISDDLYDFLYDYLKKKDPKNPFFQAIGAPPPERKVTLPVWMGSQDKIRDDPKSLDRWKAKYKAPYVLTDKLDGNSGLLVWESNGQISLYTRGDGTFGQNVSGILPYVKKNWTLNLEDKNKTVMIRGEFIISKKNWEKIKDRGANARNVTAGILNSKTIDPSLAKYVDFVAYELLSPKLDFQEGLEWMKGNGFAVVEYDILDGSMLTVDYLSNYLLERRKQSPYEIDGIVVRDNEFHKIVKGKNPKYSFAFKTLLTHDQAEVMVSDVEWNVSKDGYLKPTVHFNPVHIGGVKIQKATGFNGAFIQTHKIGPGSKIIIIRSGDVIPHIVQVVTPSATGEPSFPKGDYQWNESGVELQLLRGASNDQQRLKQLEHCVKTLDIPYMGPGTLKKLVDIGIRTIPQWVRLTKADLLKLEGVQEKGAEKMFEAMKSRLETVTCEEWMVASNLWGRGFGLKKIQSILNAYPEIREGTKFPDPQPIPGVGKATLDSFFDVLPQFYEWMKEIGRSCGSPKKKTMDNIFEGKSMVFTGFRNKEWEKIIESMGGKLSSSVSKNTFLVVAADVNDTSQKIEKAQSFGILISKENFQQRYKDYFS